MAYIKDGGECLGVIKHEVCLQSVPPARPASNGLQLSVLSKASYSSALDRPATLRSFFSRLLLDVTVNWLG